MGIENLPIIQGLDKFAQALPEELRAELYRTAEAFLSVGAMHGVFTGLASSLGTTSKGDQQKEFIEYLSAKYREYSTR